MWQHVSILRALLWLNDAPLYQDLLINSSVDGHLGAFSFWPLRVCCNGYSFTSIFLSPCFQFFGTRSQQRNCQSYVLCFVQAMPFPSHIHTIQLISPLALPFGFLQEAGWMPFLGALRARITYIPLSKQFCLYIISTQFLLSPSLHHMVLKADTVSYSGSITSIRHSSWNILSAQRCFIE